MCEFSLPLSQRDRRWIHLRERLARAAREIHFVAIASDTENGPMLLRVAESLGGLAMSIPMTPRQAEPRRVADQPFPRTPQLLLVAARPGSEQSTAAHAAEAERANG